MRYARAIILLHSFVKISASFPRASGARYVHVCTAGSPLPKQAPLIFCSCARLLFRGERDAVHGMHTGVHTHARLNSHCCVPSKGRSIERHALSSCNNDGPRAPLYALSFITTRSAALSRLYFISH